MVIFCFFFCFAEKSLLKEVVVFVHLLDYIFLRYYRIKETSIFHFFVLYSAIREQKHQYNLELSFADPYMSKLKVEFNYSTSASTIQLLNYSTIQVKVGGDLEG